MKKKNRRTGADVQKRGFFPLCTIDKLTSRTNENERATGLDVPYLAHPPSSFLSSLYYFVAYYSSLDTSYLLLLTRLD